MPYVTDAAREYSKNEIKEKLKKIFSDRNQTFLKVIDLFEQIEKYVNAFHKKYPVDMLEKMLDAYELDGPDILDELSPNFVEEIKSAGPRSSFKESIENESIDKLVSAFLDNYQM